MVCGNLCNLLYTVSCQYITLQSHRPFLCICRHFYVFEMYTALCSLSYIFTPLWALVISEQSHSLYQQRRCRKISSAGKSCCWGYCPFCDRKCCGVQGIARQRQAIVNGLRESVRLPCNAIPTHMHWTMSCMFSYSSIVLCDGFCYETCVVPLCNV